eukprot:COSAG02_NODE_62095_length_267_cov_0.261905_1_plen_65_part_10
MEGVWGGRDSWGALPWCPPPRHHHPSPPYPTPSPPRPAPKIFFNDTATTEIYTNLNTLSLHDALP